MQQQNPKNVYEFKITLKKIKPTIWRRIQVPENYSFWDLHVAIQDAMGWADCHLHQFEVLDPQICEKVFVGVPHEDDFGIDEIIPGNKTKISKYFLFPKNKALYEYDFGDGWEHEIVLEKILPAESGIKYPRCISGKRTCPPEDCGGPWGYEELLETIKNPDDPEYIERMEWLGGDFNPEKFDPKNVYFEDPKKR
jgi:hypothetical protein